MKTISHGACARGFREALGPTHGAAQRGSDPAKLDGSACARSATGAHAAWDEASKPC